MTAPQSVPPEPRREPTDPEVDRATLELGTPEALYKVSPNRLRLKFIVGIALVVYGVLANYFWWVHGPGRFGHFQLELLILPPIFGIGLLVFMYRNRSLRVLIYPTGILRLRAGEVESYPWNEILAVRLKGTFPEPTYERDDDGNLLLCWLPITVPTFQIWSASIEIETHDGTKAKFTPALAEFQELSETIQRTTFAQFWPQLLSDLANGEEVLFGDLQVLTTGLYDGKREITWAEIESTSITQKTLSIKRRGGWLPWWSKDTSSVPNPHLLLALIQTMMVPVPPKPKDGEEQPAIRSA